MKFHKIVKKVGGSKHTWTPPDEKVGGPDPPDPHRSTPMDTIREILGRKKCKDDLPDFFKANGDILTETSKICEGFNDFFVNIGPKLASDIPSGGNSFNNYLTGSYNQNFVFNKVNTKMIIEITKSFKPKTSVGKDNISTKLLKEIIPHIAECLAHLFNLSFKSGYIPSQFKTAKVIPIFKTGDKHDFNNYRPISLLSSLSKLLEKIVTKQLINYIY